MHHAEKLYSLYSATVIIRVEKSHFVTVGLCLCETNRAKKNTHINVTMHVCVCVCINTFMCVCAYSVHCEVLLSAVMMCCGRVLRAKRPAWPQQWI